MANEAAKVDVVAAPGGFKVRIRVGRLSMTSDDLYARKSNADRAARQLAERVVSANETQLKGLG